MTTTFTPVQDGDLDALLSMMRAFYDGEHLPFDEQRARAALAVLLADRALGFVASIVQDREPAGYVVVVYGFSLEFGGRFAWIDELYLEPAARGRGIGAETLALVERTCAEAGVSVLRLEVNRENLRARRLYQASGFTVQPRDLMIRRVPGREP